MVNKEPVRAALLLANQNDTTHNVFSSYLANKSNSLSHNIFVNFINIVMEHRIDNRHLSKEVRSKIISLKNHSSLTNEEIARECGCSVSVNNK